MSSVSNAERQRRHRQRINDKLAQLDVYKDLIDSLDCVKLIEFKRQLNDMRRNVSVLISLSKEML